MMKVLSKSCLKLTFNLNLSIPNFYNTLINIALYPKADICQRGNLTWVRSFLKWIMFIKKECMRIRIRIKNKNKEFLFIKVRIEAHFPLKCSILYYLFFCLLLILPSTCRSNFNFVGVPLSAVFRDIFAHITSACFELFVSHGSRMISYMYIAS